MNIIVNNNDYTLIKPPVLGENTIEVHFKEYTPKINFDNGFILYSGRVDNIIKDCFDYTKKWNILTELEDGIVLTNIDKVETENDKYQPTEVPIIKPEPEILSLEERIKDIEAVICGLDNIAKIWFNRIVLNEVLFSEVPPKYKKQVYALLIEKGREDLIDEQ